jgi:Na+/glutamate symporter
VTKELGFNMGVLKILAIFLIIYLVTRLLFKYLIKSNKIKSSKISRIFYTDDEKFIINWEKNRKKGKLMYILYNLIITSIIIFVTSIIYLVVTGSGFNKLTISFLPAFCGTLIGNIIGLPSRWDMNEEKYYNLLNNK